MRIIFSAGAKCRRRGDEGYDQRADLSKDGIIDVSNFSIIEKNWYKTTNAYTDP